MYHPECIQSDSSLGGSQCSTSDSSVHGAELTTTTPIGKNISPHSSLLSRVVVDWAPIMKYPAKAPESRNGSRVLTSYLNEKKRKEEDAEEKQKRKEERE